MIRTLRNALAAARHHWQAFRRLGPVGLGHSIRLARAERRIARLHAAIEGEEQLHEAHLADIRAQLNRALWLYQTNRIAACAYLDHLDKQGGAA